VGFIVTVWFCVATWSRLAVIFEISNTAFYFSQHYFTKVRKFLKKQGIIGFSV